MKIYICRKGDEPENLARRFGTELHRLMAINGLDDPHRLCPGLSLRIPEDGEEPEKRHRIELLLCCDGQANDIPRSMTASPVHILSPAGGAAEGIDMAPCAGPRLLSVSNLDESGGFSPGLIHGLLQRPEEFSERLADSAAAYDGLFISFNYIHGFDRPAYSDFLRALSQRLHAAGKYLFAALPPKEEDGDQGPVSAALDYALHGELCDRLALLCYDYAHPGSAPGSPAPYDAVRRCIEYAAGLIPGGKLLLGLSHLGCMWSLPWRLGDVGRKIPNRRAGALAVACRAEIVHDRLSRTPFFTYGEACGKRGLVCFEDSRSTAEKLRLMEDFSLAGLCLRSPECAEGFLHDYDIEHFCS